MLSSSKLFQRKEKFKNAEPNKFGNESELGYEEDDFELARHRCQLLEVEEKQHAQTQ